MAKKKLKAKKKRIFLRINILFFFVFLLFSVLILRLGVIQIVQGSEYKNELGRSKTLIVDVPVPRGKMYDQKKRLIVDNTPHNAIVYNRPIGANANDHLDLAKKLSDYIHMSQQSITVRDKKDYWILKNQIEAKKKLSKDELKTLTDKELYSLQLARITENDLKNLTEHDLEVIAIKRELDMGATLTPKYIKRQGVTNLEIAVVSENLESLPGISTQIDWERNYLYGDLLRTLIGNLTDPDQGLPKDSLSHFLARGYNHNERVGTSFLEIAYEPVLNGQKKKVKNLVNNAGAVLESDVVFDGNRGSDLVLTIDMDFQKQIEEILMDELKNAKRKLPSENKFLDSAFAVVMNPKTGEILSLAGKKYTVKNGKVQFEDLSVGTFLNAYPMGSVVKGATMLTGYGENIIKKGTVYLDEPIKIKNTPIKKSYMNMGYVHDVEAIRRSSNVYMWRIAMKLGGYNYRYNDKAPFRKPEAFEIMRKYFAQFGLGVHTGIDLPFEGTGYTGSGRKIGYLMDLAIGQYDTYTPLQLAQYVSTIANDGYRVKPRIVKEIRLPSMNHSELGNVSKVMEPEILNRVAVDQTYIKRVKEGFRQVMQAKSGTAYDYFKDAPYDPAGKTGTAEMFLKGNKVYNLTLVGYAPAKNPKVSFAVVVPYASDGYNINKLIGRRLLDEYFKRNPIR